MRLDRRVNGYLPLSGYGLIGDCRSAALVGEDGSVDWLCLPRFDDASVFGRILDSRRGGHWQLCAEGAVVVQQRYRDLSNVLEVIFRTPTGRLMVTDFMPISAETVGRHAAPAAAPRLVRIARCLGGEVTVRNTMAVAPDYGRDDGAGFRARGGRFHGDAGGLHLCIRASVPLPAPETTHRLGSGEAIAFSLSASAAHSCPERPIGVESAQRLLRQTLEYWWRWMAGVRYDGPHEVAVHRSALALKLMTYAPTGAIVAAPTTSLPEAIGGVRNWDYRYTWLRDASFTLYAFFQLGLVEEATSFFDWLARTGAGSDSAVLNLYTLDGQASGAETVLGHLRGYRGSAPVRVGNAAAGQLQLDVYGEVLDSAYLFARFGGTIGGRLWSDLAGIVELAIDRWQQPDASIWEVRGRLQHFTYSKVMCWVAVDRGLRIADRFGLPHDAARWRSARLAIRRRILSEAWNPRLGAFAGSLGGDTCDASVLRMAQLRFLPDRDRRLRRTVRAVARDLEVGELVRRYRTRDTDDGLPGDEGAFLMCSFWLADALAHFGQVEEAQRLFEQLLCFSSPLGLFSEEADARTGELLGNFPQAFTHLALVGAAVNIERARHRRLGVEGLHPGRPGHSRGRV